MTIVLSDGVQVITMRHATMRDLHRLLNTLSGWIADGCAAHFRLTVLD